jgi:hypothetical protein
VKELIQTEESEGCVNIPKEEVIFVGFCRWCISIEQIVLLDFIHRLVS